MSVATPKVNTKKVENRRSLHYASYDDLLADAERLAGGNVTMLGNWSLGQVYSHLARALDASIDGFSFRMPAPVRLAMRLFMKKRFLGRSLDPGFKIPKKATAQFFPLECQTQGGLEMLRSAIERQKAESNRVDHPILGPLTREEWMQFNLRHAEMHLSFAVPQES